MPDFALCNRPVFAAHATAFETLPNGDSRLNVDAEHKDCRMMVCDVSDYFASLYTRADFFCAEYAAKEAALAAAGEQERQT
jgi:hypothetical protein